MTTRCDVERSRTPGAGNHPNWYVYAPMQETSSLAKQPCKARRARISYEKPEHLESV